MKILKLRFKNLNSLAGEWSIDFTSPEFADGLFLINGATGAGKTTILDAITLALYGSTARVKVTENENAVMSYGTGDSFSELTFSCHAGMFTACWEQHRAHNRPGANLQPVSMSIRDEKDGRDLPVHGLDAVKDIIKEKVGLDRDQFLRTIMLAQGQFDSFLSSANKETRSLILEQTTGTDIYAEIGKEIFNRRAACKNTADSAKKALEQLKSRRLTDEQRLAHEARMAALDAEMKSGNERSGQLSGLLKWLRERDRISAERRLLDADAADLERDKLAAQPQLLRLATANRALKFDRAYRDLSHLRDNAGGLETEREKREEALIQIRQRKAKAEADLEKMQQAFNDCQSREQMLRPRFNLARELDANLAEALKRRNAARKDVSDGDGEESKVSEMISKSREAFTKNAEIRKWIAATLRHEEMPAGEISGTEISLCREFERERERKAQAELKLNEVNDLFSKAKAAAEEVRAEFSVRFQDLEALVKKAREARDFAKEIEGLEEKRGRLRDGCPCPLCGSLDHPYCRGNVPELSQQERDLREAEKLRDDLMLRKNQAEADENSARNQCDNQRQKLDAIEKSIERKGRQLLTLQDYLEKSSDELLRDCSAQELRLLELRTRREEKLAALADAEAECKALEKRRRDCGVNGDVATAEKNLSNELELAREKLQLAQRQLAQAEQAKNSGENELAAATAGLATAKNIAKSAAAEFLEAIQKAGFADEAEWREACWSEPEIKRADAVKQALSNRDSALSGRRETLAAASNQNALAAPADRETAERVTAEAEKEFVALSQNLQAKSSERGKISEALRVNASLDSDIARKQKECEDLDKVQMDWDTLNKYLGGQDGKQFKSYAQGLTLARLIKYANRHLDKMTWGRYQMVWSGNGGDGEKLLPSIDDRALSQIRSVDNLSGGERFQVSLSLALGLSELSGQRLEVDSLFLDEGFGTLDDQTLDTAIQTLEGIQQGGKLIGIISHVSELERRIPVQITAEKIGGGVSSLSGAGVTRR
ncbi:MAG: AAA family ATPase [Kiritimatiellae bacterium]|nr:AAA family ATPase [Kiritimatiellia bacterium]